MIIDCHGHYTTAPAAAAGSSATRSWPARTTRRCRDRARRHQRRRDPREHREQPAALLRERGGDLMIFSPQGLGDGAPRRRPGDRARRGRGRRNDLVHRVVGLFPEHFAGVCQLPQTPGGDAGRRRSHELRRCVEELGFVGCNLNPDPSGGHWTSRPLTDEYWFPLYEAMVELDVPAMIHVSASCNPNFHALGAHYLNADTSVFMQLVQGDLFSRFPTLRFVIPHGGGAVPYHWGRYRGLADRLGRPPLAEHVMTQRLLRHLRLPPGRDRPAAPGDPGGQHPVRLGDARRGPRRRPGDRPPLGRHHALRRQPRPDRRPTGTKVLELNAPAGVSAPRRPAGRPAGRYVAVSGPSPAAQAAS